MGTDWPTCNAGFYSVKGTNPLNNVKEPYCAPCPIGSFCPGGQHVDPIPCPASWMGIRASQATLGAACTECLEGYSCPNSGTVNPEPCAPGYYAPTGSLTCLTCSVGYYCPGGQG